jgi:hypothetical protein
MPLTYANKGDFKVNILPINMCRATNKWMDHIKKLQMKGMLDIDDRSKV